MNWDGFLDALARRRQLVMIGVLVVVVVAAALVFGGGKGGSGIPAKTKVAGDGTLSGEVRVCGGSGSGGCRITNVTVCAPACETASYVAIVGTGSAKRRRAALRRGHFSATLAPGAYRLQLVGAGKHERSSVLATKQVSVHANTQVAVTFTVSFG